ncbi:GNAT family N-acetyltransferase [bacterium]|nr:GNAT family N-acetyltransferase [bacterium]MBP9808700.1 GNAT family N-acetyltransferase [bacterium]
MQIRLYSRQDDKEFRNLMQSIYQSKGRELDLDGTDNDLRNVEGSYFGNDGLFLVAEDDGVIHGFCGARIEPGTKVNTETRSCNATAGDARDTLLIKRLYVSPKVENPQNLIDKLLDVVKNHAYQLDFETVLLPES